MDEQSIIARALEGEVNAFNQLVLTYQNLAYSIAYRVLQDESASADAVQDSFIKAYRALGTFQGNNFKSWLTRIVVNTCYDMLRAKRRRATDSLDDLPAEAEYTPYLIDHAEGPEAHAERMELNALIEIGIRALPPEQRTVLVLCDIHGYAYEEIAEITGQPIGTVKSRISRARTRVRDFLLQNPELLPATFRPYKE
ncbi:MAG: sigma-70 family RNA polymerase sigma factor [Chloroflexi bacterium]|nr:sigma-70 family RNA polymerase sigma factor [Chloroflexota bacterium]